ncbi:hypothetical protein GCM10009092_37090 [Bowmanella denitrificans]|uniref:GIY-YIG domain-containing protein n=1 Tax=Bowmanella denitrificans TaxID=366582 RepID=A0ABN0XPC9_9ALTE
MRSEELDPRLSEPVAGDKPPCNGEVQQSEVVCWYLYIVENRLGHWYTGISTEPARRFEEHQSDMGKGAKALRGKGPLKLKFCQQVGDRSQASRAEYRVKQLPKVQKRRLIEGLLSLAELLET